MPKWGGRGGVWLTNTGDVFGYIIEGLWWGEWEMVHTVVSFFIFSCSFEKSGRTCEQKKNRELFNC